MTSKLLITQRALDFSQEWQGILMTACELQNVEYDRATAVTVTYGLVFGAVGGASYPDWEQYGERYNFCDLESGPNEREHLAIGVFV